MTDIAFARLRAHARPGASPAEARRLRARIEASGAEPPGPPSEILILRRLADPAPGALGEGRTGARAERIRGARPGPGWDRALQAALDRARDRAARPILGPVDPQAEAVRFADAAEALACLLRDLAAGTAPARWWWASWPPERPGAAPQATAARGSAALLVPLDATGARIAGLLAADPRRAAAAICLLAARGEAVRALAPLSGPAALALAARLGAAPPPRVARPSARAAPDTERRTAPGTDAPAEPSAIGWLIAVARSLRETPAAGPEALAARAAALLSASSPPARADASAASPPPGAPGATAKRIPDAPGPDAPAAMPAPQNAPPDAPAPRPSADADRQGGRASGAPTRSDRAGDPAPPSPRTASPGPTPSAPPAQGPATDPEAEAETGVATRRAGTLFLANLFARPDLAPDLPAEALAAPWNAMAELAALLDPERLPPDAAAPRPDPLPALLRSLDGAPPEDAAEPETLRAALAPALPDLRARLGAAMGVAPDAVGPRLVRRAGRVFVTTMHVDLTLPLDALDVAVRRAGLDIDPGWRPRLGRIVAFHYRG
ncbi:MAG: hypothetical protein VYD87_04110 [Pseudomonadota bacterium]|nr:hypothetical protein [Pseudomonadota bacterium]